MFVEKINYKLSLGVLGIWYLIRFFLAFLFILSFTFCNSKDEILILEKGKKKEFIAINEELKVCFDKNSNVCVLGKLIEI